MFKRFLVAFLTITFAALLTSHLVAGNENTTQVQTYELRDGYTVNLETTQTSPSADSSKYECNFYLVSKQNGQKIKLYSLTYTEPKNFGGGGVGLAYASLEEDNTLSLIFEDHLSTLFAHVILFEKEGPILVNNDGLVCTPKWYVRGYHLKAGGSFKKNRLRLQVIPADFPDETRTFALENTKHGLRWVDYSPTTRAHVTPSTAPEPDSQPSRSK